MHTTSTRAVYLVVPREDVKKNVKILQCCPPHSVDSQYCTINLLINTIFYLELCSRDASTKFPFTEVHPHFALIREHLENKIKLLTVYQSWYARRGPLESAVESQLERQLTPDYLRCCCGLALFRIIKPTLYTVDHFSLGARQPPAAPITGRESRST